jgi:hypothetical protein
MIRKAVSGNKYVTIVEDLNQVEKLFPEYSIISRDDTSVVLLSERGARTVFLPRDGKRVALKLLEEIPRGLLEEALGVKNSAIRDRLVKELIEKEEKEGEEILKLSKKRIWLWGVQGVGKTTAVIKALFTLTKYYLAERFKYFTLQRIDPEDVQRLKELVEERKRFDLIILDDLNAEIFQKSPEMAKDFIYLVSELGAKATVTISNQSLKELVEALKRLKVEKWIISRVVRLAKDMEIEVGGKDRRVVEAGKREKERVEDRVE